MLRTFDQHLERVRESLDGWWDFTITPDRTDKAKLPKAYTRSIHVPRAWETMPGLETYRGKGWLRSIVQNMPGMGVRLVFAGVSHTADVYVDGKHVGHHEDAFTPFDVVIPPLKTDEFELVLEVDNAFGDHAALHIGNDYYSYGGITRPAEVQYVPEVFIEKLFATPVRKGKGWELEVVARLRNWSDKSFKRTVEVELNETRAEATATVPAGKSKDVPLRLTKLEVKPWSNKEPVLYPLYAFLHDDRGLADDLIERVGFREIKVKGKQILLNGESIRLRGYNRHEDHPHYGCAIPVPAMVQDLEILHDLGCNFVRTCHYPNDQRFLDLCDELGFYVWEESHARNIDLKHPAYRRQITASTTEMIEWHFNHPSILMWGTLNECETETAFGAKEHRKVFQLMRKLDPSRPITFASNRWTKDLCFGDVDIVSWNIYTGWYGQTVEDIPAVLEEYLKWLHSNKSKGGKGKPVILSEFGAGALYGHRTPHQTHWSEEYQCTVLDACLQAYLNHKDVAGAAIWQFCDVRVTEEGNHCTGNWWSHRPRTMNNKGTVDEYRRPKLAYDVVKQHMLAAAKKFDK